MSSLKTKLIIIVVGLLVLGHIVKAKAEDAWPATAVARNAQAMARTGREVSCISVARIAGALPYCLALVKHEPERCNVIKDQPTRELCIVQSTPPK